MHSVFASPASTTVSTSKKTPLRPNHIGSNISMTPASKFKTPMGPPIRTPMSLRSSVRKVQQVIARLNLFVKIAQKYFHYGFLVWLVERNW